MTLETLQKEMNKALKSGDKFRKSVISTTIAQIKTAAIDAGIRDNITEDFVDKQLQKAKKITEDMINTCPTFRPDLLENYVKQAEIIKEFAPTLIENEDEIRRILLNCGIEINQKNQGNIMKFIKSTYGDRINMKIVNKVFKELWTNQVDLSFSDVGVDLKDSSGKIKDVYTILNEVSAKWEDICKNKENNVGNS